MAYQAKDYSHLLGIDGFSDTLLNNHFTLYKGYVANTNKLVDQIRAVTADGKYATPEVAEQQRRFGWEFNGMRLHEYYFGNMTKGGKPLDASSPLAAKMKETYGSQESWAKDFKGIGAMRGIGWVTLAYDAAAESLFNIWTTEHEIGNLAGATPLLVMDVWEHAYITDYAIKRPDYIEAFFKALDWSVVSHRLAAAKK